LVAKFSAYYLRKRKFRKGRKEGQIWGGPGFPFGIKVGVKVGIGKELGFSQKEGQKNQGSI